MVDLGQIGSRTWLIDERNRLMGEVGQLHNEVGQLKARMRNGHITLGWLVKELERQVPDEGSRQFLLDDLRRAQEHIEAGWDVGKPEDEDETTHP